MSDDQLNDLLDDALEDLLQTDSKLEESNEINRPEKDQPSTSIGADGGSTSKGVRNDSKKDKKPTDKGIGVDEEEMNKFFENMRIQLESELPKIDPDEARAKINESVPQIFDLMQNLLSKELLYPALKDLAPKFDNWLKENSANLSATDRKRYKKQKNIINEIIDVFDDESLDNQERFERNLDLMEKMQSLGSPPQELTVPASMEQCSIC